MFENGLEKKEKRRKTRFSPGKVGKVFWNEWKQLEFDHIQIDFANRFSPRG